MDYSFDSWKKALSDFKSSVAKDLEEIRQQKEEVQKIKEEIMDALSSGYYLRDDHRLVLSAPEIIIGNVDRDGTLKAGGGSLVIVRGNSVDLQGVGDGGHVHTRAASIRQIAVDPGIDGMEAVVQPVSEIVTQARQVVLEGNTARGAFSRRPASAGEGGVSIHADGILKVEASQSNTLRKTDLENRLQQLDKEKSSAEKAVSGAMDSFTDVAKTIVGIRDGQEARLSDEMTIRTSVGELYDIAELMESYSASLHNAYENCARAISRLAEINRQITCLKAEKSALAGEGDYKKKPTGASVAISSERIDMVSVDGDGNLRDNPEAGINLLANAVKVQAVTAAGELQKEGKVSINAQTVEISTQNTKDEKYDKGELQSGTYTSEGDFVVKSKNITFEALDQEFKDKKLEEKALTKDGSFTVRTEKVDVSVTDTEGKATGSIALNAKDVSVRSMNVDKEKRTDDKLAEGSTMLLLSEKMFVGAKKKDIKSKKVQVFTEEAGVFADKTLELQQGEAKAVLQLEGGNASLGGSKTQVYGETSLNGKTEVKDELKAPKATIDHVEAKSSFKSSNISDGIPVPPPPSTAKLSAKLKAEDAPEKK